MAPGASPRPEWIVLSRDAGASNAARTTSPTPNGANSLAATMDAPATTSSSGPVVTAVLNNYSYTPAGFVNSGIAQGALFVIFGTGLADPTKAAALQDATRGLPTALNGARVEVTSGGATVTPAFYYASATQMALVLPSNTPVGTAQVTVSYNGQTSVAYSFQVVQTAPGFATYYGTGTGLGAALNAMTYAPYSYVNSIPPGTTVVLYGSGLGADPATDAKYVPATFNINSLAHIYVGGVDAPILYQGSFDYPGLDQIDVTIPLSAPTGCNVSLVGVTAAGVPTNFITLPIGNGTCSDPAFGITGNLLLQTTVKTALVQFLVQPSAPGNANNYAFANFDSFSGSNFPSFLAESPGVAAWPSLNTCVVSQTLEPPSSPTSRGLNGGSVSVSGPVGVPVNLGSEGFASLSPTFIPATGGSFTFQSTGGADVGIFLATTIVSNPEFSWTNLSAAFAVTRSSGLPVTWSGGGTNSYVQISGTWSAGGGPNPTGATARFNCTVPASAGQFTVPPYMLAALPAGLVNVQVNNENNYAPLGATGVDWGSLQVQTAFGVESTFQ
jgi:uncharacterized protein (TIGR03437 family)